MIILHLSNGSKCLAFDDNPQNPLIGTWAGLHDVVRLLDYYNNL